MFGKKFFLLLGLMFVMVSFLSCANPNYQDDLKPNPKINGKIQRGGEIHFSSVDLFADFAWDPYPEENKFGSFVVGFWSEQDPNGVWRDPGLTLSVVLWMPSMGHGSAPVKVLIEDVGLMRAKNVFFSMHGNWEIRLKLKKGSELVEQVVVPFEY